MYYSYRCIGSLGELARQQLHISIHTKFLIIDKTMHHSIRIEGLAIAIGSRMRRYYIMITLTS